MSSDSTKDGGTVVNIPGPFHTAELRPEAPIMFSRVLAPSLAAEQYRKLAVQVEEAAYSAERTPFVLAITSPGPGTGKTLTSVNLAITLSRGRRKRVLLVECDLWKPSMSELVDTDSGVPGLYQVIKGAATLRQATARVKHAGIEIVTAGTTGEVENLMADPGMVAAVDAARPDYDVIILDSPPFMLASGRSVAGVADGLVLVARAGRTNKKSIENMLSGLGPQKVLGMILNGVRMRRMGAETFGSYAYYTRESAGRTRIGTRLPKTSLLVPDSGAVSPASHAAEAAPSEGLPAEIDTTPRPLAGHFRKNKRLALAVVVIGSLLLAGIWWAFLASVGQENKSPETWPAEQDRVAETIPATKLPGPLVAEAEPQMPPGDSVESAGEADLGQLLADQEKEIRSRFERQISDLERRLADARQVATERQEALDSLASADAGAADPGDSQEDPTETAEEADAPAAPASESESVQSPSTEQTPAQPSSGDRATAVAEPEVPAADTAAGQPVSDRASGRATTEMAPQVEARVRRGDLVTPGPGVNPPRLVRHPTPRYPRAAQALKREARVRVRVLVDETGKPSEVRPAGPRVGMGFDREALRTAQNSLWEPATKDGVEVKMWLDLLIDFRP